MEVGTAAKAFYGTFETATNGHEGKTNASAQSHKEALCQSLKQPSSYPLVFSPESQEKGCLDCAHELSRRQPLHLHECLG